MADTESSAPATISTTAGSTGSWRREARSGRLKDARTGGGGETRTVVILLL